MSEREELITARKWKGKITEEIIMKEPIAIRRRGRVSENGALIVKGEPAGQTERDFEISRTDRARGVLCDFVDVYWEGKGGCRC